VTPAPLAKTKITVDGAVVENGAAMVELKDGKKTVRVVAKASGYKTYDEKIAMSGDHPLEIKLKKKSSGGGGGGGGGGSGTGSGGPIIDF